MLKPSILLDSKQAKKVGKYATGQIGYELLTDEARQNVWIRLITNDSSGWFSKEIIHSDKISECLTSIKNDEVILSKSFAIAFKSKSSNNAGFLAAALRSEGLLIPAPDQISRHLIADNWHVWTAKLLKLPGVPLVNEEEDTVIPGTEKHKVIEKPTATKSKIKVSTVIDEDLKPIE